MGLREVVMASLLVGVAQGAGLLAPRASGASGCSGDEFHCDISNACIPRDQVCDGSRNCYIGDDELGCGCSVPFMEVDNKWCVLLNIPAKTWKEAKDVCESYYADLHVLDDLGLYGTLIDFIQGNELTHLDFWVGASDQVEEGVWVWTDGTPVRFGTPLWGLAWTGTDYYGHEPKSEFADGEDCGFLDGGQYHYMVDGDCSQRRASVCHKRRTQGHRTPKDASVNATVIASTKAVPTTRSQFSERSCRSPFEMVGDRCLMLEMEKVMWVEALYICRSYQAELASLSDVAFHADLVDYFDVKGVASQSFWIGANDTASEGVWAWLDGSPVRPGTPLWRTSFDGISDWHQEPYTNADEEDCALLDHNAQHYMADAVCTLELPAVCLKPE